MSAFTVSQNHVDVVVGGLVRHGLVAESDRNAVGTALHEANVAGVNHRYPHHPESVEDYAYTEHAPVSDVVLSKVASCLSYNSDEHPEWETSEPARLLAALAAILAPLVDESSAEYAAAPREVEDGFLAIVYSTTAYECHEVAVTTATAAA